MPERTGTPSLDRIGVYPGSGDRRALAAAARWADAVGAELKVYGGGGPSVSDDLASGGLDVLVVPAWNYPYLIAINSLLPAILELFPVLAERRNQFAGTLPGGEQQMLAIGRGLASAPELLMLDEPSMGLAPTVVDAIVERIHLVRREHGLTILLVEQRVAGALETCDQGYVLETGRVVLRGSHDVLMSDERVRRAYLGM